MCIRAIGLQRAYHDLARLANLVNKLYSLSKYILSKGHHCFQTFIFILLKCVSGSNGRFTTGIGKLIIWNWPIRAWRKIIGQLDYKLFKLTNNWSAIIRVIIFVACHFITDVKMNNGVAFLQKILWCFSKYRNARNLVLTSQLRILQVRLFEWPLVMLCLSLYFFEKFLLHKIPSVGKGLIRVPRRIPDQSNLCLLTDHQSESCTHLCGLSTFVGCFYAKNYFKSRCQA